MTKYERKTFLMDLQAASGNMEALLQLQYDLLERFSKYLPVLPDPVDPVKLREAIAKLTAYLADPENTIIAALRNFPATGDPARVGPLNGDLLSDLFAVLEAQDLRVAWVVMPAREYHDLRKSGFLLDQVSDGDLQALGYRADVYGAKLIVWKGVPRGRVYIVAEGTNGAEFGAVTNLNLLY